MDTVMHLQLWSLQRYSLWTLTCMQCCCTKYCAAFYSFNWDCTETCIVAQIYCCCVGERICVKIGFGISSRWFQLFLANLRIGAFCKSTPQFGPKRNVYLNLKISKLTTRKHSPKLKLDKTSLCKYDIWSTYITADIQRCFLDPGEDLCI